MSDEERLEKIKERNKKSCCNEIDIYFLLNLIEKQQKEIESYKNMIKERFISKAKIKVKITELNNSMVSGQEENIGLMIHTLKELLEE